MIAKKLYGALLTLAAFLFSMMPLTGVAQTYPACAWPIEASPEGNGNLTFPDTFARYWWMPFEAGELAAMTITGTYPNARYFSFVVYDEDELAPGVPGSVAGHLYDAQIAPDPGSINPFVPSEYIKPSLHPAGGDSYTIEITGSDPTTQSGENTIAVATDFAWVLFRIYLPDKGESLTGGVPLPRISLTDKSGNVADLELCSAANGHTVNGLSALRTFMLALFPPGFDLIWQEDQVPPPGDRLWFAAPDVPPVRLFPNPDNKYIMMLPGPWQPDRVIVIHGKAPSFPGTFAGATAWEPARGFRSIQTRYWSACHNNFLTPMSVVACATDVFTEREGGYYTIVISNDQLRPDWLNPHVTWLPWGDGAAMPGSGDQDQIPKVFFLRNMLSADDFPYSIQQAIGADCTFDFQLPYVPYRYQVEEAGRCAEGIMGDYYPVAAWCDRSTFIAGGWRACLR